MSQHIPKLLHQTFPRRTLPPPLSDNCARLRNDNQDWPYFLYDDEDIEDFIATEYGQQVLSSYLRISPAYGAARADLFRYLLMYQKGGAYIDIKSSCSKPLSQLLTLDEGFVLSKWGNTREEFLQGAGLHPELAAFPGGEFQQWHIICVPQHPFLAAVIDRVLANISEYRPWRAGVGRTGVLRVTGPIAYTLAIEPIKNQHKHIELSSHEDIGLQYSSLGSVDHRGFFKRHYTQLDSPIVSTKGTTEVLVDAYIAVRRLKHRLLNSDEDL
jgi:mannosyltransferase OCH1-like enzyme